MNSSSRILLFTMLAFILLNTGSRCQNTFQKVYQPSGNAECFGAYQTSDQGYIYTGIIDTNGYKIFMCRTDCNGAVIWTHCYDASSTIGNISQRVIQTHDDGFLLAASAGSFSNYNIALVKTDPYGNTQWHKIIQGNRDDVVNSVIETSDHYFMVAGKTNSWGQEVSNNIGYSDIYLAKIDSVGGFVWGKTIGTSQTVDEAFDIVETTDSGYATTGRYIEQGTFYCFLLKTDKNGSVSYIKAYGDTNQSTNGYALIQTADGGFAITGSTTIMKSNYQSYADEFIIKTNSQGDTLWCKTYHGTNTDGSENGSSIVELPGTGYAIGVATMSYPTIGFVPNKHLVIQTNLGGNLLMARTYNHGSAHYPYLSRTRDQLGYLLSGFTNTYSSNFQPVLIRMNNLFVSGCNETNVLALTVQENPPFQVRNPQRVISSAGTLVNSNDENALSFGINILCENIQDTCSTASAVHEISTTNENLLVHVDASSGTIFISGNESETIVATLYNTKGQLILQLKNKRQINISSLNHGLYLLTINSNGKIRNLKLYY